MNCQMVLYDVMYSYGEWLRLWCGVAFDALGDDTIYVKDDIVKVISCLELENGKFYICKEMGVERLKPFV